MRSVMGCGVFLLSALLLYAVLVVWLQRKILFPAPAVDALPTPAMVSEERVEVPLVGGPVEVLLLPPLRGSGARTWLLFAHGNGEVIDLWGGAFEPLRVQGVGVALAEYPGYGRSAGRPSERSIRMAMVAAYDLLAERPDVDRARIVGYGRSLGGGAVCALAKERDLAGLILESSFTSLRPLARRMGVPGFLVLDPFDNEPVVAAFDGPILVLHGERDAIIPVEHGRRLAQIARSAQLIELPCGHNDCPRPWEAVSSFLATIGETPDP